LPLNLSRNTNSNSQLASDQPPAPGIVVPISPDVMAQGLLAIGGCRQCSRTFTDRLELIHHFVDHFPSIFYSFEQRKISHRPHSGKYFEEKSNF
jgi:hypothetical protein